MSEFDNLKTYRPRSLVYEGFLNGSSADCFFEKALQTGLQIIEKYS